MSFNIVTPRARAAASALAKRACACGTVGISNSRSTIFMLAVILDGGRIGAHLKSSAVSLAVTQYHPQSRINPRDMNVEVSRHRNREEGGAGKRRRLRVALKGW